MILTDFDHFFEEDTQGTDMEQQGTSSTLDTVMTGITEGKIISGRRNGQINGP